ncbi:hypothetical protein E5288_WYG016249 [Bos mutus]|uniref:Uncharacterized protein n=1 Tax=Bos mutus TaxID=72004 RepID=A0A6B0RTT2_9CETA|nr:hypothetical protein [Bos mutus]
MITLLLLLNWTTVAAQTGPTSVSNKQGTSKSLERDVKAPQIPVPGSFPPPPKGKSTSFAPGQKTGRLDLDLTSLIER